MVEHEEFGEGVRSRLGELADYRDSFYEDHKHEIIAGINPEYREYRKIVEEIKEVKGLSPIKSLRDPFEKLGEFLFGRFT